jgi:hypothetical protein
VVGGGDSEVGWAFGGSEVDFRQVPAVPTGFA